MSGTPSVDANRNYNWKVSVYFYASLTYLLAQRVIGT